ncbi:coiled-coil domain-containing protein 177 [Scleropages formosus]|uniref:Coiled-coil domain-containing protein 177-like n=1 Tax=Scleropages formosus TaxID=113540 RepID=A0A8C9VKY0_SCLFO|nr:coiled-coil domain-containing protein 177 [Scleropages formosus]
MVDPSEAEDQGKSKGPGPEAPTTASEAPRMPEQNGSGAASAEGAVEGATESGPSSESRPQQDRTRDPSPKLHLDLYNFDSPDAEGSRYVLTSPHSLEACARCGVKPVELLPRPLVDFAREAPGRSMRVATGLFEAYEKDRHAKLKQCREERERIIREERRRLLQASVTSNSSSASASVDRSPVAASVGSGHPSKIVQTTTGQLTKTVVSGAGQSPQPASSNSVTSSKSAASRSGKISKSVPVALQSKPSSSVQHSATVPSLTLPFSKSVSSVPSTKKGTSPIVKSASTFPRSTPRATSSVPRASTSLSASGTNSTAPVAVTGVTPSRNGFSTAPFAEINGFASSQPKRQEKSHSLESLQRRREPTCSSTTTRTSSESGASSSYSWEGPRERWVKASSPRARTLATFNSLMGRSLSLGDLSHSPQTTQKVERIVKEVKRRGLKAVPERDRKIAALMLAKYQEEDIMSQTRYVAHLQWDSERRLEELRREREEREKQRAVQQCQRAWHSQVSTRQQRLTQQEQEATAAKLRQVAENEEKWREMAEQQERSRMQRLQQAAREEKQKKVVQEQNLRALEEERAAMLEQDQLLLQEKLSMAELKRQEREHQIHEERRGLNRAERRRHTALIREIARREAEEREVTKKALEEKLSRSSGNYEQIMERRGQELREKARREEKQIQRAKRAAEERERQQQEQLEVRAKETERRAQQAAIVAEERAKEKALRAVMSRQEKEKLQRMNRQRVEEEEQQRRLELLQSIERKLEKSEQIFREKRAVLESARSMARASFHVRDRVREETNMRTFDKMALEAKLKASLDEK